ncbi:MAG: phosphonate C-P lyase system protein PhnG [Stappiaceae bacterium]
MNSETRAHHDRIDEADHAPRQRAIGLLSGANAEQLSAFWQGWANKPQWQDIRPPETGLVMTRGRIGGSGNAFNLGEATVTRCVIGLASGITGYGYILGRDHTKARIAALFDGLWQQTESKQQVEDQVLTPLEDAQANRDRQVRQETAATKVDFFTMVRGDD